MQHHVSWILMGLNVVKPSSKTIPKFEAYAIGYASDDVKTLLPITVPKPTMAGGHFTSSQS
jgi:hypothetical protein